MRSRTVFFINEGIMKKSLIVLLSFSYSVLNGCAYDGWEEVKIEPTVVGQSCELKGKIEECHYTFERCETWFKKRAIKAKANTTVFQPEEHTTSKKQKFYGRYYNCQTGLPPYTKLKFSKKSYSTESNTVTGQAFLRQKGGGVVTCAGEYVVMYPNTEYFKNRRNGMKEVEYSKEVSTMEHFTQCDAEGNFEFDNIESGSWVIETAVRWEVAKIGHVGVYPVYVPGVYSFGYYYKYNDEQGGHMKKQVTVKSDQKNRFIISGY